MVITLLLLSVAGAVIAAVIGTFWYSNATPMGRLHMQYLGFDKLSKEEQQKLIDDAKPTMWKTYLAQMALSFLTAFFTVFVITLSVQNGVPLKMAVLFPMFSWLCFVVPTVGSAILWGNCDPKLAWKKFFSDSFSILVIILAIALMTSFFL